MGGNDDISNDSTVESYDFEHEKNEWLSRITEPTPEDVKSRLVSVHPPTPSQLISLPWSNTTDGGAFAWCTEAIGEQNSAEKTLYFHVGSASCYNGSLSISKCLPPF